LRRLVINVSGKWMGLRASDGGMAWVKGVAFAGPISRITFEGLQGLSTGSEIEDDTEGRRC